jgi:uncharacterized protein YuzE
MQNPINMRVDFTARAGYVQYRDDKVVGTLDVWEDGTVAADVSEDRSIVGIEVLALEGEALAVASDFAHENGLSFPVNIAEALTVA